jgi:hypothetical protein
VGSLDLRSFLGLGSTPGLGLCVMSSYMYMSVRIDSGVIMGLRQVGLPLSYNCKLVKQGPSTLLHYMRTPEASPLPVLSLTRGDALPGG